MKKCKSKNIPNQPRYNAETEKAIEEANKIANGTIKSNQQTVDEFFKELKQEEQL